MQQFARAYSVSSAPTSSIDATLIRIFDVVLSAILLVLLSPLLVLMGLLVMLDSPGPAMFKQLRTGAEGKAFRILKFRTMTVMEDGETVRQARINDHRVTRIGAFLRRTSLDELPQLFNVFVGDMSLVGPRPHAIAHDMHYVGLVEGYAMRYAVKPGMTGLAQISGARGETSTVEAMARRVALDTWYVRNHGVGLYLKILFATPFALFRHRAF